MNPLDVGTPGVAGPVRDLMRRIDALERQLANVRATTLTGQALHASPEWGHRTVRRASASSLTNDTWSLRAWTVPSSAAGAAVAQPSDTALQATAAGLYLYSVFLHFVAGGASGLREMRALVNGAILDTASETTAGAVTLTLGRPVWLAAGDVVTVEARQISGGALDVSGVESFSGFTLALLRGA